MAPNKRPHSGGKPKLKITAEIKAQAQAMAGFGLSQEEIACVLGISETSLKRYCRDELHKGVLMANAQVIKSLYENAKAGNVAAQIFWTKARCGWREPSQRLEHSGPDGRPIQTQVVDKSGIAAKLAKMTDAQLDAIIKSGEKA